MYKNADEIDFESLPEQFVIKCNHNSKAGLCICKDKSEINVKEVKRELNKALKVNCYYGMREYPYKDVKPHIIVEKYMKNNDGSPLIDYKFWCFNGEPQFLSVGIEGEGGDKIRISYLNMDWSKAAFGRSDHNELETIPEKPELFDEMVEISRVLSKNIPFLRVDLYYTNGKVYFGECTFAPASGFIPFTPIEYDEILGELIKI